ncbi:hypothetical protein U9M48_024677 [Paspalum notatum var. saurae]|uniref:Reverse transcriptase zinc-binding domain-containing protein n=1 Tax=Paspalum notatum var. saurae TaxID=547442 RepID=A0AAQ3TNT8_PASNO
MCSEIGNRANTLFWTDKWLHGQCIADIAPQLFRLVPKRRANKRTVLDALNQNNWISDLKGALGVAALVEYLQLWDILSQIVLDPEVEDRHIWRFSSSGQYSAKSAYEGFFQGGILFDPWERIWKSWAPGNCRFFMWLVAHDRCWTADRLARRGLQHHPRCLLCDQDFETIDHLLASCVFSRQFWFQLLQKFGLQSLYPEPGVVSFGDWWRNLNEAVSGPIKQGLNSVVILGAWSLWKLRNRCVFDGVSPSLAGLVNQVSEELELWGKGYLPPSYPGSRYDEDSESMNTRNLVEFEVNGLNLAEIQDGEVTVTNLHSSNGPDFIFHLTFSEITESIESILEKLRNDGYEMKDNFDSFSRVSVRRLGRLLPDARWGSLPFMVPRQIKGQKAELFRRCCKRVKCFVETDAGFCPTLSKTDLAQHNPFTKALRDWGSNNLNSNSVETVEVEAHDNDRKPLSYKKLEKQYYNWIKEMHEKYDVEMDDGDDEPTLIVNPINKERLGISNDVQVVRVHRSISRKEQTWRRGDHLKILPGATGRMKTNFYSLKNSLFTTLEYIVVEGLQGDICAEDKSPNIYIQESVSFPVSIIDNKMCKIMDHDSWNQMLQKRKEKAPARIEVLSDLEGNIHGLGDLRHEDGIKAGHQLPKEIIAVMRPGNYKLRSTGLLDQKYILKDGELEMVMEIRYFPGTKDCPGKQIDKMVNKPSSLNGIDGLYIFSLRKASLILSKSGVYQFIFSVSCRDSRVIQHETTITVYPDANSGHCIFSVSDSPTDKTPVDIRLGSPVRRLAIKNLDKYGNRIPFLNTASVIATILDGDDVLAEVDNVEVELSSDSLTLNVSSPSLLSPLIDDILPAITTICAAGVLRLPLYLFHPNAPPSRSRWVSFLLWPTPSNDWNISRSHSKTKSTGWNSTIGKW